MPLYHPSPNVSRPVTQLTEDEQVKIAKRIGLIQHLPSGIYDGTKKVKEYVHPNILLSYRITHCCCTVIAVVIIVVVTVM